MKTTTLILTNPRVVQLACDKLRNLELREGWEVTIKLHKKSKSAAQRGLQWMWYTVFSGYTGQTKEEVHEEMKRRFCVPILIRDDEDYAAMIGAAKVLPEHARREIVRMTSTERLDTAQMTEYLNDFEQLAIGLNFPLPHPGDYNQAMGIKER